MSDFLTRLAQGDAPVPKEVTIGGETGTVYFRRISGAQREQLLKGMKLSHTPGGSGSIDIDLGENEKQRHMLVAFSVCDESGKRVFTDIKDVAKLQADRIAELWRHASAVNEEGEDPGKS